MMALPPATAAQTDTALVRCASGKVPVIVDRVAGITNAAPSPITARRTTSSVGPDAVIASAEPTPKTASPSINASRRPYRSPSAPAVSSREANTSE